MAAFGFLIAALVLFIVAAVGPLVRDGDARWAGLVPAGLACLVISLLLGGK